MFNNEGWICPKCGQVFAPWVWKCDKCPQTPSWGTGTGWPPPSEPYTGDPLPGTEPITTCDNKI